MRLALNTPGDKSLVLNDLVCNDAYSIANAVHCPEEQENKRIMPDEHAGSTDTSVAVSVIVPFYNAVDYLEECINSVLEQDVEAVVELLLIDDCSTDGGDCLAERVFADAGADRRCVLVRQPQNAGTSTARNTGIEMSRGALCALFGCRR